MALGRAIVREPQVFLLDEPLSNLDAHLRVQMRAEILRVHRAVTATAVYVTHDQIEALTMGDRIVVMNAGRIQQVGTPDEFTMRRSIGSSRRSSARRQWGFSAAGSNGIRRQVELVTGTARIGLSEHQARRLAGMRGDRVVVGIRPERLSLAGQVTEGEWSVSGVTDVVEMLGAEQYVHFTADGGSLTARVPRDHPVRVQQE